MTNRLLIETISDEDWTNVVLERVNAASFIDAEFDEIDIKQLVRLLSA